MTSAWRRSARRFLPRLSRSCLRRRIASRLAPGRRFKIVMRKSNVALRLQSSLLDEARRVSEAEGVALNQFINVAVAEKLSALRTEEYFLERGQRGNPGKAKRLLKR